MRDALVKARGERSQDEVARELDIAQQYLSDIERGNRTPSAKVMSKLAAYYDLPVEQIFGDIFLKSNTAVCGSDSQKEAS